MYDEVEEVYEAGEKQLKKDLDVFFGVLDENNQ